MIDVSPKTDTLREAKAQAILKMLPSTREAVENQSVPKGNVLEVARTAGILAAKRTSELIPFCHPVPLDLVSVEFTLQTSAILIQSQVKSVWKTGVEMEALLAATLAALTAYDMLKPLDETLEIQSIRLLEKRGGKKDFLTPFEIPLHAAVIVTSDGTYAGKRPDKSGKIIAEQLKSFGVQVDSYVILPDDLEKIKEELLKQCEAGIDLIMTTGGTGLGPRDVTVEATQSIIERQVPGILESARAFGQRRTPYSMLSRGIAGVRGKTLIVNLPGSSKGASESLQALLPGLFHAFPMLWGGGHPELPPEKQKNKRG